METSLFISSFNAALRKRVSGYSSLDPSVLPSPCKSKEGNYIYNLFMMWKSFKNYWVFRFQEKYTALVKTCYVIVKITYSTNHECTQNALNRGFGKYNQTQSKYTTLYIVAGNILYFIFLPNIISTDLSFLRLQLNRNVTATVKSIARKLLHTTLNIA